MKIQGKKIEGANVVICPIPRGNGSDIIFKCRAILNMDDFDSLCPVPVPPINVLPGNRKVANVEDPIYKSQLEEYGEKRLDYMVIKALEATEGIEWDSVDLSDSDTWKNYKSELKDSGFSAIEIMRIFNACMEANCLDERKLDQARDAFLASQRPLTNGSPSQADVPNYMLSGGPVNE